MIVLSLNLLLEELVRVARLDVGRYFPDLRDRFEPWVLGNFLNRKSALRVYFEKLGNQIFSDSRESFWPFDFKGKDVLKELVLRSPLKRR